MSKDTINIVTSFSVKGWKTYAKKMIESASKFLSDDLHLTAYYHDFDKKTVKEFPKINNITFKNLNTASKYFASCLDDAVNGAIIGIIGGLELT